MSESACNNTKLPIDWIPYGVNMHGIVCADH